MSRSFDRASSQYLEYAGAVAAMPLTLACWVYPRDNTNRQVLMSIADNTSEFRGLNLILAGNIAGDPVRADANDGSGIASTSTTYALNAWQHVCGVFAATSSRAVYLDGGGKGTNTGVAATGAPNRTSIGRLSKTTPAYYSDALIAVPAVWSVALSDDEVALLAAGLRSTMIRPEALVAFWPLYGPGAGPEWDEIGSFDLTITGATPADDPPLWLPEAPAIRVWTPGQLAAYAAYYRMLQQHVGAGA